MSRFGETNLSGQVVRAIKTLREMFDDRGYASHGLIHVGDDDCVAAVASRETMQVPVVPGVVLVIYTNLRHNGSSVRSDMKKRLNPAIHKRVIVVFREVPLNVDAAFRKLREDINAPQLRVEVFALAEVQYNVTRHYLVPRHERVSEAVSIASVLKKYGVKKGQLPIITKNDPVARYLGVEPGELVRVTRNSATGGEHAVYRHCV